MNRIHDLFDISALLLLAIRELLSLIRCIVCLRPLAAYRVRIEKAVNYFQAPALYTFSFWNSLVMSTL